MAFVLRPEQAQPVIDSQSPDRSAQCQVLKRTKKYVIRACKGNTALRYGGNVNFEAVDANGRNVGEIEATCYRGGENDGDWGRTVDPEKPWCEIHWVRSDHDTRGSYIGRALYEAVVAYGCGLGAQMVSDQHRSRFDEHFWRKLEAKGKASCAATGLTDPEYFEKFWDEEALEAMPDLVAQSYSEEDVQPVDIARYYWEDEGFDSPRALDAARQYLETGEEGPAPAGGWTDKRVRAWLDADPENQDAMAVFAYGEADDDYQREYHELWLDNEENAKVAFRQWALEHYERDADEDWMGGGKVFEGPWKETVENAEWDHTIDLDKLDARLPKPAEQLTADNKNWPCLRYTLKTGKLCKEHSPVDLGRLPKKCPPGYRAYTTKNGVRTCRKKRR